jgi:biopolymer transport protein ExbD
VLLRRPEALGHEEDHLDMTPMVDVVFQLMTFLLITFQTAVVIGVDLPKAKHGRGIQDTEALILAIAPPQTPNGQAMIYEGPEPDPAKRLESVEAITTVVKKALDEGRKHVVLEAAGNVPHGEVLRLAAAVAKVPGIVLHIGVEEAEKN